jgi:hypothetical protein
MDIDLLEMLFPSIFVEKRHVVEGAESGSEFSICDQNNNNNYRNI